MTACIPVSLVVQRLSSQAKLPKVASSGAAGYDLFASETMIVPARGKALVPTGLAIAVPQGHYGRIAPRSSLAWKHHIDVGAGVIDRDYRGPVGVVLFNHANEDYSIDVGDRIAQLILERISECPVHETDQLVPTERGSGGFGSTGK